MAVPHSGNGDAENETAAYWLSTGIPELDQSLGGLQPGDNVVWQVDEIAHYRPFAQEVVHHALEHGERVIYFRFAGHPPVLEDEGDITVVQLHPEFGFENFITQIHETIRTNGRGGYYIFDSLSGLSTTLYSDRMIGNFFKLTCPYLRRIQAIAYFALYRHVHSYHALRPIENTTQILIDAFRYRNDYYLKPAKCEEREDCAHFALQRWDRAEGTFRSIRDSGTIAAVLSTSPWTGLRTAPYRMVGLWDWTFLEGETVRKEVASGTIHEARAQEQFELLVELVVPRDEQLRALAHRYLDLDDMLRIWKRMIGTGMIGGKTMGMLLARAILRRTDEYWEERLEPHDSFYIGSDVFYTYLVENDCWWDRQRQKDPHSFKIGNERVKRQILEGEFPEYVLARFRDMLDYFGTDPIIVRSSSLLEDNFGNAFSGKYASVFCANQGDPEERLEQLVSAVKTIYASSMSDEALDYRKHRGVLEKDEQMALLVQRVSGAVYGRYFLPQVAGVAYSFNPYAWNPGIDPRAGVVRLVFGLGTRAVDRSDDDYTRIVALNVPQQRPESDFEAVKRHTQRRVDVIDLERDEATSVDFFDLVQEVPDRDKLPLSRFAIRDHRAEREAAAIGLGKRQQWVLTFDQLLQEPGFVGDMRRLLETLKDAYHSEVDVEFTANFRSDGSYTIDVVQCRRFPVHPQRADPGQHVPLARDEDVILRATRGVIGQSRTVKIDRLIYVRPEAYHELPESARYELASYIGKLAHAGEGRDETVVVVGPGRWGTSTPSLGVPVSFSDINGVSAMWEFDIMREGLTPDLSLGTHFFNDMVEMNMLYVAHRVEEGSSIYRPERLEARAMPLASLGSAAERWREVLCVITDERGSEGATDEGELDEAGGDRAGRNGAGSDHLYLHADAVEQQATLYVGV
jgi:hypothetical protein